LILVIESAFFGYKMSRLTIFTNPYSRLSDPMAN
jgi:hypothetical protein